MHEEKSGPVEVAAGDTCSECWRPAVFGYRSIYGDVSYDCVGHYEINIMDGKLDWLTGERDFVVGKWLEQVQAVDKSAWDGAVGNMKHFMILKDKVSDDIDMPYKQQHAFTLQALLAAVDEACKLTQEKINRKKSELQNITEEMEDAAWDAIDFEAERVRENESLRKAQLGL